MLFNTKWMLLILVLVFLILLYDGCEAKRSGGSRSRSASSSRSTWKTQRKHDTGSSSSSQAAQEAKKRKQQSESKQAETKTKPQPSAPSYEKKIETKPVQSSSSNQNHQQQPIGWNVGNANTKTGYQQTYGQSNSHYQNTGHNQQSPYYNPSQGNPVGHSPYNNYRTPQSYGSNYPTHSNPVGNNPYNNHPSSYSYGHQNPSYNPGYNPSYSPYSHNSYYGNTFPGSSGGYNAQNSYHPSPNYGYHPTGIGTPMNNPYTANMGLQGRTFGGNSGFGGYGGLGGGSGYGSFGVMNKPRFGFGSGVLTGATGVLTGLLVWNVVKNGFSHKYDVYNHRHLPEDMSREIKLPDNVITTCAENLSHMCGENTKPLCTSDEKIMCVVVASATIPCGEHMAEKCINSTEQDQNKPNIQITVSLPCIANATVISNSGSNNNTLEIYCVTALAVPQPETNGSDTSPKNESIENITPGTILSSTANPVVSEYLKLSSKDIDHDNLDSLCSLNKDCRVNYDELFDPVHYIFKAETICAEKMIVCKDGIYLISNKVDITHDTDAMID